MISLLKQCSTHFKQNVEAKERVRCDRGMKGVGNGRARQGKAGSGTAHQRVGHGRVLHIRVWRGSGRYQHGRNVAGKG